MRVAGLLAVSALCAPLAANAAGACLYQDDLEPSQDAGWTFDVARNDAGPTSPTWAVITDAEANSRTHSFSSDAKAAAVKDDRLIAPPQDLTAESHLIFWHRFNTEDSFDGGVLEVSTDGGATWVDVLAGGGSFVTGGYNGTIDTDFESPISGRRAWTGFSEFINAMNMVEVDLGAFAGTGVLVRWRLALDNGVLFPGEGWWVDDVQFTNLQCDPPEPPGEESVCVLPGITVVSDPDGDFDSPGSSNQDIQSLSAAELAAHTNALTFTMKVADLGTVPANGIWRIYFTGADGVMYYVSMESDAAGSTTFSYGTTDGSLDSGVGNADSGSFTADGYIHITVSTSKFGTPAAGQTLTAFLGRTFLLVGAAGSGLLQRIDDEAGQTGAKLYELKGNAFCGLPSEDVCVAPGLSILADQAGDILVPIGQTSNEAWDVRKLSISQPYFANGDYKVAFHLKVEDLTVMPQNTVWPVNFCSPAFACVNPDVNTQAYGASNKYYTVRMVSPGSDNPGAEPIFQILQPTAAGNTLGTRTNIAADSDSGFTTDGLITIVAPAADIGLSPANAGTEKLGKFQVRVRVGSDASGGTTPDNMPDGLAGEGEFRTVPLTHCAPNLEPVASLTADPQSGEAPFTVTFTASGTDTEGELVSFTLDFGDGQKLEDQEFAGQVSVTVPHTYEEAGSYLATLLVTDAKDKDSTNAAQVEIDVSGPPVAHAGADFTKGEGEVVTLDGSDSNDGNVGTLSYTWTQKSGPAVILSGDDTATPSFIAPAVCDPAPLSFTLTVTNVAGTSEDNVTVTVTNINQAPTANAGADITVDWGQAVTLDAAGSSDPDSCQTLTFAWAQVAGPPLTLQGAGTPAPTFAAPDANVFLKFGVRVTDPAGASTTDEILVTVRKSSKIGDNQVGALPQPTLLLLGLLGLVRVRRRR